VTRYSRRPPSYHRPESGFLKGIGIGMGVGCGYLLFGMALLFGVGILAVLL